MIPQFKKKIFLICFTGAILLMAARNAKNIQKSEDWMPPPQPDHASTLNTNFSRSQKSEIL